MKRKLFTPDDLHNLRMGFYTQAPTVAALLSTAIEDTDATDVNLELLASSTVELIEALVSEISEVEL